MRTMQPWKTCNSFDITHQAQIRGGWKNWILWQKPIQQFWILQNNVDLKGLPKIEKVLYESDMGKNNVYEDDHKSG